MATLISEKITNFIHMMVKDNLAIETLWWAKEYLPKDVEAAFYKLMEQTGMDEFQLFKIIRKNYEPDKQRITYRRFYDINVKQKQNLVAEQIGGLSDSVDELVLVPLQSQIIKDGFEYDQEYLIFPNIVRRNFHLTEWLSRNWRGQWQLQCLIDHNKLGLRETVRHSFLKAHWFGPKSVRNIRESFDRHSVAVFRDDLFFPDRVEFYFHRLRSENQEFEWHLEVEELLPLPGCNFELDVTINDRRFDYYTRYAHAILDENLHNCTHFDVAVRAYNTAEEFERRVHTHINHVSRRQTYQKLMRLDCINGSPPIPYEKLIALFMTYNPYVLEFFEEDYQHETIEEQRRQLLQFDLKDFELFKNYFD
jgi:hypothetical protein